MFFFFFNDTATTEIYTLSLHDALPIFRRRGARLRLLRLRDAPPVQRRHRPGGRAARRPHPRRRAGGGNRVDEGDRKSTRLNSSHANISYAVFCLKKKKKVYI